MRIPGSPVNCSAGPSVEVRVAFWEVGQVSTSHETCSMAGHCFPGFELHFQKIPVPNYRNGCCQAQCTHLQSPYSGGEAGGQVQGQARLHSEILSISKT